MISATEYRLYRIREREGLYEIPDGGILLGYEYRNEDDTPVEVLMLVKT